MIHFSLISLIFRRIFSSMSLNMSSASFHQMLCRLLRDKKPKCPDCGLEFDKLTSDGVCIACQVARGFLKLQNSSSTSTYSQARSLARGIAEPVRQVTTVTHKRGSFKPSPFNDGDPCCKRACFKWFDDNTVSGCLQCFSIIPLSAYYVCHSLIRSACGATRS